MKLQALGPSDPKSLQSQIPSHDFSGEPFIALRPMRRLLNELAQSNGVKLNVVGETQSNVSACEMVAQGLGVTIADVIVPLSIGSKDIAFRPWSPGHRSRFGLLYPAGAKPSNAAANDFASILVETTLAQHPNLIRPLEK